MRAYRMRDQHALIISELDQGVFGIKGDLTFATIDQTTIQAIDCKRAKQLIQIDLNAVNNTDSAGLALIIEWLKISKKHNSTLRFINIPPQLKALTRISGINEDLTL